MSDFIVMFFVIGILAVLFYTPKKFYEGIMLMQYGAVPPEEKLKAWIPIYNVLKAENLYRGGQRCFVKWGYILLVIAAFIEGAVLISGVEIMSVVMAAAVIVDIAVVLWYLANVLLVGSVLHASDCVSLPMLVVMSVVFPLGQDYIGKFLPIKISNIMKEDKVF